MNKKITILILVLAVMTVVSGCWKKKIKPVINSNAKPIATATEPEVSQEEIVNNTKNYETTKENDPLEGYNKFEYQVNNPAFVNLLKNKPLDILEWEKYANPEAPFIVYYPPEFDKDDNYSVYTYFNKKNLGEAHWGAGFFQDSVISIVAYPLDSDNKAYKKYSPGRYKYELKNGYIIQSILNSTCKAFIETQNYFFLFESGICSGSDNIQTEQFRNILFNLEIKDILKEKIEK